MPTQAGGRTYATRLETMPRGRVRVPVPFDPDQVWGSKVEHHVAGTVAGFRVRGTVVADGTGWSFSLGPAWLRDCPV
ncbi:MAG: hypothetical protein ACRDZW_07550, partial [Acidimicrobiales bacterium]